MKFHKRPQAEDQHRADDCATDHARFARYLCIRVVAGLPVLMLAPLLGHGGRGCYERPMPTPTAGWINVSSNFVELMPPDTRRFFCRQGFRGRGVRVKDRPVALDLAFVDSQQRHDNSHCAHGHNFELIDERNRSSATATIAAVMMRPPREAVLTDKAKESSAIAARGSL